MTDKERLRIIRNRLKRVKENAGNLNINDFVLFNVIAQDINFILEQNERYSQALEFYADRRIYELEGYETITKAEMDKGSLARERLET